MTLTPPHISNSLRRVVCGELPIRFFFYRFPAHSIDSDPLNRKKARLSFVYPHLSNSYIYFIVQLINNGASTEHAQGPCGLHDDALHARKGSITGTIELEVAIVILQGCGRCDRNRSWNDELVCGHYGKQK
jgi:hypothetical protein